MAVCRKNTAGDRLNGETWDTEERNSLGIRPVNPGREGSVGQGGSILCQ